MGATVRRASAPVATFSSPRSRDSAPLPTVSVPSDEVTAILRQWSRGDAEASARLIPLVYDELRQLARGHLRRERDGHTLQPTALVHEAYLRLVEGETIQWQGRAHFYGIAARLMRRVLVDHARNRSAAKRGGGDEKISLELLGELPAWERLDLLALDAALQEFARTYPRQAEVVELKFFGGLEVREIAEVMKISDRTILRDWSFAKVWLFRALKAESGHAA